MKRPTFSFLKMAPRNAKTGFYDFEDYSHYPQEDFHPSAFILLLFYRFTFIRGCPLPT